MKQQKRSKKGSNDKRTRNARNKKTKVQTLFDKWATKGQAESMETGHGPSVKKFLKTKTKIGDLRKTPFTFLDVGCGNGWVVRAISNQRNCKAAYGIDTSSKMIKNANKRKALVQIVKGTSAMSDTVADDDDDDEVMASAKESYRIADIEKWKTQKKFDVIFSMEVMYYTVIPQKALKNIHRMLTSKGVFYCGVDFYAENKATAHWADKMKIPMHLLSKKQWVELFTKAGFSCVKTTMIKDKKSTTKWKREMGTLFITGTKSK